MPHVQSNTEPIKMPSPDNFEAFFPWLCNQYEIPFYVIVTRIQNQITSEYKILSSSSKKSSQRSKSTKSKTAYDVTDKKSRCAGSLNLAEFKEFDENNPILNIYSYYDNTSLVKLKFNKNKRIPQTIFDVLGLILKYHTDPINITINRGLNNRVLNSLNKLSITANITELCLDGATISNVEYDILLKDTSSLRQMSLSRCNIDDDNLKNIASKLVHPLPAALQLYTLNLASNRITDIGAKYIADALRSNRQLFYLNLAGNMISDEGGAAILDVLKQFSLTPEEYEICKANYKLYWKYKYEIIKARMLVAQAESVRPSITSVTKTIKKTRRSSKKISTHIINPSQESEGNEIIGHPFSKINTHVSGGMTHCYGNNNLAYLNLSYNNVSYFFVKKLLDVILIQKALDRQPRGLVKVSIEGNCIPTSCLELRRIADILQTAAQNTAMKYKRL